jgi:hypothetical protein
MLPREYIDKFCEVDGLRFWLSQPTRDTGRLLASDGHIAISTRDDSDVLALIDSPLVGALDRLIGPIAWRDNWQPLDMPLPPAKTCYRCGGVGRLTECAHCDGMGIIESDTGPHDVSCPKCNGAAEWADPDGAGCHDCNGTGEGYQPIAVGNTFFQRRYLALLQSLPGPVRFSLDGVPSGVAFFRFADGCGALMPCKG